MKIKFLIFSILTYLLAAHCALSNTPCDDESGYTSATATWQAPYIYGSGSVNYKYKDVGSDMNLKIDWSTYSKTNPLLSDKVIKDELVKKIMQEVANQQPGSSVFPCNVRLYFTQKCKARLKTVYLLDQSASLDCCPAGFNPPSNLIETLSFGGTTRRIIKKYADVDCGEKCCVLTYTFVYNVNPVPGWYFSSKFYSTVSNCDPNSSYFDCLTSQPIPCTSGNCQGYGE